MCVCRSVCGCACTEQALRRLSISRVSVRAERTLRIIPISEKYGPGHVEIG